MKLSQASSRNRYRIFRGNSQRSGWIFERRNLVERPEQVCTFGVVALFKHLVSAPLTNYFETRGCSSHVHLSFIDTEPLNDYRNHQRISTNISKDLVRFSSGCSSIRKALVRTSNESRKELLPGCTLEIAAPKTGEGR